MLSDVLAGHGAATFRAYHNLAQIATPGAPFNASLGRAALVGADQA
jgi:hypothetical protein